MRFAARSSRRIRRAWTAAAKLPRIAAIASATPVAYSSRRLTTRTVASWSSIEADISSTLPSSSGMETSPKLRPRRSTRPRTTEESAAVSSATVSLLTEPARGAESESVVNVSGSGPRTWKTTTRER